MGDVRQYAFLDECGVATDLLRRYGRSPRGTRLDERTPCSHWQTHPILAALRLDGLTAPAVFDDPIDHASFLAYVEQVWVPPGQLQVTDSGVPANSSCSASVKLRTNAFDDVYTAKFGVD